MYIYIYIYIYRVFAYAASVAYVAFCCGCWNILASSRTLE